MWIVTTLHLFRESSQEKCWHTFSTEQLKEYVFVWDWLNLTGGEALDLGGWLYTIAFTFLDAWNFSQSGGWVNEWSWFPEGAFGASCAAMFVSHSVERWPLVSVPRRISLEDLSPSVVLHMTEKLGYKNSDVINTVLSNRACHILAIYFLLNKKLERYLSGVSGTLEEVDFCPVLPSCWHLIPATNLTWCKAEFLDWGIKE